METNKNFDASDIYSVESINGDKLVHFHGYLYDKCERGKWANLEYIGFYLPLTSVVAHVKNKTFESLYDMTVATIKRCVGDLKNKAAAMELFSHYCNGEEPKLLPLEELTLETEDGCYYNPI